jgi:hypothetical protein
MTTSVDLFGNPIITSEPPAPYHETYDPYEDGCTNCQHLRLHHFSRIAGRIDTMEPDRCKVLRIDVDVDFGTCGRFEARS